MSEVARYDHRFHVGNAGDVWKHVAWLAVLAAFKRERVAVLDLHAGRGSYALPRDGGEWRSGVGRLWDAVPEGQSTGSGAVDRYLARVRRDGAAVAGSPLLALHALGRSDVLVAHEVDPETAGALREAVRVDGRARVVLGDGWSAPIARPAGFDGRLVVLVDPPYTDRADWGRAADAIGRAHAAGAAVVAWYPIKRWSRPQALHDALRAARVPFVALDLVHIPVETKPKGLAGSGVVLVGVPASAAMEILSASAVLGPLLATHDGRWSLRATAGNPGS